VGALGGFLVGYIMGTKAGRQGIDQLVSAWNQIVASDEFKALLQSGTTTASAVLGRVAEQGKGVLGSVVADQAKQVLDRRLSRVA